MYYLICSENYASLNALLNKKKTKEKNFNTLQIHTKGLYSYNIFIEQHVSTEYKESLGLI